MRILVISGTSYLGSKFALEAKCAGHEVVALVRTNSDATKLESLGAVIVRGDITDTGSLPSASKASTPL